MTILPQEASLGLNQIQVIVKAMVALSKCDGVHDAERVMIRGFYENCQRDAAAIADYEQLVAQPFDAAEAREILDSEFLRHTVLRSCLLLAHADGEYSAGEQRFIAKLAADLGVNEVALDELEEGVKEHLLQQIARVGNVDALRSVAGELGISLGPGSVSQP